MLDLPRPPHGAQAGVDRANARLAPVEQIKRFAILAEDWLPDSDELTHHPRKSQLIPRHTTSSWGRARGHH